MLGGVEWPWDYGKEEEINEAVAVVGHAGSE